MIPDRNPLIQLHQILTVENIAELGLPDKNDLKKFLRRCLEIRKQAHLLKHMLEQQNIPVFITGEHLGSAAGELPAMGLIDVWVIDDFIDDAQDVLDDFLESLDGPGDDDDDDELIGADGYYMDDIEPEETPRKRPAHADPENPWNRVYRQPDTDKD